MARKREDNLRPCEHKFTLEEAKKGAENSAKARRQKKTVAEYLCKWADGECGEKELEALKKLGLDEGATRKTLLILPLIKKANSGDIKALQMILELLGEDKKREAEIKRLNKETELLKAEIDKLRMQVGDGRDIEDLTPLGDMLTMKWEDDEE